MLQYLHNGLTGSYTSRTVRLEGQHGVFRLTTETGKPIERLRLTARRVLVGIGDLMAE